MENQKISEAFMAKAQKVDGQFAIAYALLRIADEQASIATQIKYLGNGDAATAMGAVERLAVLVKEGLGSIADQIGSLASAIEDLG